MRKGVDYIGVSVGALIFNDKGELFLNKRSQKTRNERGKWEAPGGGVRLGEKRVEALRREILEEFGVEIEILEELHTSDEILKRQKQHWVPTSYVCKLRKGQKPKIMEPEKSDEIGWFALDKLPKPLSMITRIDLEGYKKRFKRPRVGVDVVVVKKNKVLLGKRRSGDGIGTWHFPGGHLELGEEVIDCARREVKEETGLEVKNMRLGPYTSNIYKKERKHYISIFVVADVKQGEPVVMEEEKCERWGWFKWSDLPNPLFLPVKNLFKTGFKP